MATQAPTRDLTITLPEPLIEQVQLLAKRDSTDVSEVVARLIRAAEWQDFERFLNKVRPAPRPEDALITEEDIVEMIHEDRAERRSKHATAA